MKKIILISGLLIFANHLFATHYSQKGNISKKESAYAIHDKKLVKLPEIKANKIFYEFYSDCSGLKNEESGLVKTGMDKYIGASGRTHIIADIFAKYERRAKAMGIRDYHFVSKHDSDVFVVFDKKGEIFTIDIYTGEDALKMKEELGKKK